MALYTLHLADSSMQKWKRRENLEKGHAPISSEEVGDRKKHFSACGAIIKTYASDVRSIIQFLHRMMRTVHRSVMIPAAHRGGIICLPCTCRKHRVSAARSSRV